MARHYESELLAFPNGLHDDQVDATSYALHYSPTWLRRVRPPVRRSHESIRGAKRRLDAERAAAAAIEPIASDYQDCHVTIEDGRRITTSSFGVDPIAEDCAKSGGRTTRSIRSSEIKRECQPLGADHWQSLSASSRCGVAGKASTALEAGRRPMAPGH